MTFDRAPMFASFADAGKNIAGSFMSGYNLGGLAGNHGSNLGGNYQSVGGALTSLGGRAAFGGGLGAVGGAALAATMDVDPMTGAAIGGGIGAAVSASAVPLLGATFRGAEALAGGVGKLGKIAYESARTGGGIAQVGQAARAAGNVALRAGSIGLGSVVGAAKFVGESMFRQDLFSATIEPERVKSLTGKVTKTGGLKMTGMISGAKQGFRMSMQNSGVDWTRETPLGKNFAGGISELKSNFAKVKELGTKKAIGATAKAVGRSAVNSVINGKTLLVAGAAVEGFAGAAHEYQKIHMGQIDNYVTTNTPKYNLLDNAGATGDLVFAMNANRRG